MVSEIPELALTFHVLQYVAPGLDGVDVHPGDLSLPDDAGPKRGLLNSCNFGKPEASGRLATIKDRFPTGVEVPVFSPSGTYIYTGYRVDSPRPRSALGLP